MFIDSLMNDWIILDQHEDVLTQASNEAKEPYFFKTNYLWVIASNEQFSIGMFIHIGEEIKLLQEMVEIEEFMLKHAFVDARDGKNIISCHGR